MQIYAFSCERLLRYCPVSCSCQTPSPPPPSPFPVHLSPRPQLSWRHVWQSLLYLHNQTGNIYSHGFCGLAMTVLMICTYIFVLAPQPGVTAFEYAAWSIFFFCAQYVLYVSATFHLTMCHSQRVCKVYEMHHACFSVITDFVSLTVYYYVRVLTIIYIVCEQLASSYQFCIALKLT